MDRRYLVAAACACAQGVLHLVPAGENRPRRAIETAIRWTQAEATLDEVRAAAADDAAAYAAYAAYAAASAASATTTAATATAAYGAADAAAYGAADAAWTTRRDVLAQAANRVRAIIPWHMVAERLRAAGVEVST